MLQGSCLCQRVRYRIEGAISELVHCHCQQCRKSHGAAFASYINLRKEQLHWLNGTQDIRYYASSQQVQRGFCQHCASPLSWHSQQHPHWISVPASSLDAPANALAAVPQRHVHTDNRPDWACVMPSLSQH